ncbi:SKU5 similar 17 [Striga hermonthica]|uniref:SKU5 similar 17 n=1 Tax=Striga hermonthica TaxID=68872 RepID=A0A9N7NGN6_STRHE|nr:SKU5 similar 17 [Striga hermonthica]
MKNSGLAKNRHLQLWNLTSNVARPNPQVNGISHINPDTRLKLAYCYNNSGVFSDNFIQSSPPGCRPSLGTYVLGASLHDFIEVVFQNNEYTIQSWCLDGYDFWVVGFGNGQWMQVSRQTYNLDDALTRHTTQHRYIQNHGLPYISLFGQSVHVESEVGNVEKAQYLGQQLYLRVYNATPSFANDTLHCLSLCGSSFWRRTSLLLWRSLLAEVIFGTTEPLESYSAHMLLTNDEVYFTTLETEGSYSVYGPRSAAQVEELTKRRRAKEVAKKKLEELVNLLKSARDISLHAKPLKSTWTSGESTEDD